jgi:micrococcal nuclease
MPKSLALSVRQTLTGRIQSPFFLFIAIRQPFGTAAKHFTSELAFGKIVTVVSMGKDRYGRTIADVFLPDNRLLNHELVKVGFAWWFKKYALGDETLKQLEADARKAKRGLWIEKEPVPPWEWRREHHALERP